MGFVFRQQSRRRFFLERVLNEKASGESSAPAWAIDRDEILEFSQNAKGPAFPSTDSGAKAERDGNRLIKEIQLWRRLTRQ